MVINVGAKYIVHVMHVHTCTVEVDIFESILLHESTQVL